MRNFDKIIAYEDEHVLIVDKPVGMASQSERGFDEDVLCAAKNYLATCTPSAGSGKHIEPSAVSGPHTEPYAGSGQSSKLPANSRQPIEPYAAVINRLDKPVGGLVLIAKDSKTAASLSALSGEHSIEKWYWALVSGVLSESGEFTDYLVRDGRNNTSKVCAATTPQAKKAVLSYEPMGQQMIEGQTYTLVRVRLYTGRHHQIRVQMAHHGHALYGDLKYNPEFHNRRGVSPALYAYHLSFHNPYGADVITVESRPKPSKEWALLEAGE